MVYWINTDPGVHHGSSIELDFQPLSKMVVESDHPVTLQAVGSHPFLFLNTDDGSVIQGVVVSTAVQNVNGKMAFQFGPEMVSPGHWEQVASSEADSSLQLVFTGNSEMGVTTYPDLVAPRVFMILVGILFCALGSVLIERVLKSRKEKMAHKVTIPNLSQ
jgi:hypothetical protein